MIDVFLNQRELDKYLSAIGWDRQKAEKMLGTRLDVKVPQQTRRILWDIIKIPTIRRDIERWAGAFPDCCVEDIRHASPDQHVSPAVHPG